MRRSVFYIRRIFHIENISLAQQGKFNCGPLLRAAWSGQRDLNPRLRPWQGRTLPLSYTRMVCISTLVLNNNKR